MTVDEALKHATLPLKTAGQVFFHLSRSCEAAKRGDFETLRRRIVVPVAPIAHRLGPRMEIAREMRQGEASI